MPTSPEYRAFLEDQLARFGGVQIRRMFGGSGLYRDGAMFGLVARDVLYFRVDDRNRPEFEARGMTPFTYRHRNNKSPVEMPYYELPEDVLEDADELAAWARKALDAALAAKREREG